MKAVLLIDFGSTYTKITAVDVEKEKILGTAQSFTTIETDINDGLNNALAILKEQIGEIEFSERYACSSAAGGLRMVAIGLVVVPALGVLMMVYYLYQREFFASVLVGALGLLGLWMFRSFGTGTMYYGCLILALVVALVGVVLAGKAKAKDGVITLGGRDYQLFQPECVYSNRV